MQSVPRFKGGMRCTSGTIRAGRSSRGAPCLVRTSVRFGMAPAESKRRLPAYFLAHGGGPMPLLGDPSHKNLIDSWAALRTELRDTLKPDIKAVLVVDAHWECNVPTVSGYESPPGLTYDYYGFPPEAYKIKYPAKGSPEVADRVQALLRDANLKAASDSERGLDHGAFVPMKMLIPEADIPVLALSLVVGLDPGEHLRIGEALAPLREEGVLIIGSGLSFHNMQAFGHSMRGGANVEVLRKSQEFDRWLTAAVTSTSPDDQHRKLKNWDSAPSARFAHPREEHLSPLFVVAGAAACAPATVIHNDQLYGAQISSFKYA